jgi:hypothetical protein
MHPELSVPHAHTVVENKSPHRGDSELISLTIASKRFTVQASVAGPPFVAGRLTAQESGGLVDRLSMNSID